MDLLLLVIIIIVAFLPGILWMTFFLTERVHPEPTKIVAYTFFVGILISIPIIVLQSIGIELGYFLYPSEEAFAGSVIGVFILFLLYPAFIEELFKFFAAVLAVGGTRFLKTPVDAMLFTVAAGLGLATFENVTIAIQIVSGLGGDGVERAVDLIILRFVGATLLHALASAIVGYYWAKAKLSGSKTIFWLGIIYASIVHGAFNYLIAASGPADYLIIPSLFLLIIAVFVFKEFDELRTSFLEFQIKI